MRLPAKSTTIWIYKVKILGIYDKNISTVEIDIPLKQFKQYLMEMFPLPAKHVNGGTVL